MHGSTFRGLGSVPRPSEFDGRFGRLFPHSSPFLPSDDSLHALAAQMLEPPPPPDSENGFNNPDISAGYTYFGQFIDHDLTFDPVSILRRFNDPDALVDFRTPGSASTRSTAAARTTSPSSTIRTTCTC